MQSRRSLRATTERMRSRRLPGSRPGRILFLVALLGGLLASCRSFPLDMGPFYLDSTLPVETRVADLLGRMSIEEKVGQMTMAGAAFLAQPSEITKLGLGSLLLGGTTRPRR